MNYRLIAAAAIGHTIIDLHQGGLPVLLPLLRDRFELSYALVTSLVLVMQISSALVQPTVGFLSDRYHFRWLVPVSCLLASGGFLFLLGGSYALAAFGILVSGLGVAGFHPEGSKLAHLASTDRKAYVMSIFSLGGTVGTAIGPMIMTFLVLGYGLAGVSRLLWITVPAAIIFWRLMPGLYGESMERSADTGKKVAFPWRSGIMLPFSLLMIAVVLRAWAHTSVMSFIPLYFSGHLGGSAQFSSALLTVYITSGAIGAILVGLIADRWGIRATFTGTLLCGTLLLYGFTKVPGPSAWAFVLAALSGAMMFSTLGITTALGQQMFPHHVGLAAGLVLGATVGTGGFGAVLLGYVADLRGMETAMAGIPLFALAATVMAIGLVVANRRMERLSQRTEEPVAVG